MLLALEEFEYDFLRDEMAQLIHGSLEFLLLLLEIGKEVVDAALNVYRAYPLLLVSESLEVVELLQFDGTAFGHDTFVADPVLEVLDHEVHILNRALVLGEETPT